MFSGGPATRCPQPRSATFPSSQNTILRKAVSCSRKPRKSIQMQGGLWCSSNTPNEYICKTSLHQRQFINKSPTEHRRLILISLICPTKEMENHQCDDWLSVCFKTWCNLVGNCRDCRIFKAELSCTINFPKPVKTPPSLLNCNSMSQTLPKAQSLFYILQAVEMLHLNSLQQWS